MEAGRGTEAKRGTTLRLIGRHQIASVVATAVDFATMILAVELLRATAVVGTATGATVGAVTNFTLGRTFTFRVRDAAIGPQALRYALVSASSAGLNALGEHIAHDRLGIEYIAARVVVALLVSLAWNFPLQRYFVFRAQNAT
jgi:putative flippase GtrA